MACKLTRRLPIRVEHHADARSFIDVLSDPHEWTTRGKWHCQWAFRGQQDARWPLVPSAWRNANSPAGLRLAKLRNRILAGWRGLRYSLHGSSPGSKTRANRIWAYAYGVSEFQLVLEFVEMANALGYAVPGIDRYRALRSYDWKQELRERSGNARFSLEPNPATALAQHHGVPTRLLDWTKNPLTAAFFAAEEVPDPRASGRLSVWAINIAELPVSCADQDGHACVFTPYEVPRAESSYMHAQDALFIYPAQACEYYEHNGTWPSLEWACSPYSRTEPALIRKLTLPKSEAGELLRLLWLRGISRAHLMPTLDNAAAALATRWRWDVT